MVSALSYGFQNTPSLVYGDYVACKASVVLPGACGQHWWEKAGGVSGVRGEVMLP